MHKPFAINFRIDTVTFTIRLNDKGELFCFFPRLENASFFLKSCSNIEVHNDAIPNHVSLHKDGTFHIKYNNSKKTIINRLEKSFKEIDRKALAPGFSFSIRIADKTSSVICLIAGRNIIENLDLLPEPYAYFLTKGEKNNHIQLLINSKGSLEFGYLFMFLPFPITKNDYGAFSMTVPFQENDLLDIYRNMILEERLQLKIQFPQILVKKAAV